MAHHVDAPENSMVKARRKLLDQQRMRYRRAIELYGENRRLQSELASYCDPFAGESTRRLMH
ncbi:PA3496 family putative envelope integrity protein [Phytopseudomonas dryadis]|uniref:Transcriptional regulator n=1 Tax=Phytopseudomonas dryadis TaxID=2487520 RepID=A0ABY1Z0C2_9GAMM|nr:MULTISPECIES: hypothetical protein [Pseudomonas]TBV00609.1 hypothetical protein DNK34_23230 [Pseudomonas dryadis]TBV14479.1 hypothetical protein DNK41_19910 [Pseudomonas sp. FRB 230]